METINTVLKKNSLPDLDELTKYSKRLLNNNDHKIFRLELDGSIPLDIDIENNNVSFFLYSIETPWIEILHDQPDDLNEELLVGIFTDNYIIETRGRKAHLVHFFNEEMNYKFSQKGSGFTWPGFGRREMIFYKSIVSRLRVV